MWLVLEEYSFLENKSLFIILGQMSYLNLFDPNYSNSVMLSNAIEMSDFYIHIKSNDMSTSISLHRSSIMLDVFEILDITVFWCLRNICVCFFTSAEK